MSLSSRVQCVCVCVFLPPWLGDIPIMVLWLSRLSSQRSTMLSWHMWGKAPSCKKKREMKQEGDVILSAQRERESSEVQKIPTNYFISLTLDPVLEVTNWKHHPAVLQRYEEVMSPCWLQWLSFPTGLWSKRETTLSGRCNSSGLPVMWQRGLLLNVNPPWNREMDYRCKVFLLCFVRERCLVYFTSLKLTRACKQSHMTSYVACVRQSFDMFCWSNIKKFIIPSKREKTTNHIT